MPSSRTKPSNRTKPSPLRRADTAVCVARQGKLCRCSTCTSSFVSTVSTATTVSDVSTTCPPSDIGDSSQDFESPGRARCQPLQAFPTNTTLVESVYDYQDNEASAGEFVGPDGRYMSFSQNPLNFPLSRTQTLQSLGRTDSMSSVASDRTVCPQKGNALQRNESVVSSVTVDDYEYEEPATFLPPLPTSVRSVRAQPLGPTRSDYNLTPTPAIPLGRPADRRRFKNAVLSDRF
ncbi:hypothetical protein FRC11_011812, partial [Ceratobasidium sp. 423]